MKLFRTGEFARKAGVTVRTLRYYDRLGLLKPAAYSASGQRLYSELDYARLQQIVTLKLIGLSLAAIKGLLTTEIGEISDLLERQKQVLAAQAHQLAQVIATIEAAQRSIQTSQKLDLEQMMTIIRAVNMNTQTNWLQSFLTDDQQEKLAEQVTGQTLAEQKHLGEAWKQLFADIRQNLEQDPQTAVVQALVERWDALISQYGAEASAGLNAAYAQIAAAPDAEHTPPEVQAWAAELQAAANFIQRAKATLANE